MESCWCVRLEGQGGDEGGRKTVVRKGGGEMGNFRYLFSHSVETKIRTIRSIFDEKFRRLDVDRS